MDKTTYDRMEIRMKNTPTQMINTIIDQAKEISTLKEQLKAEKFSLESCQKALNVSQKLVREKSKQLTASKEDNKKLVEWAKSTIHYADDCYDDPIFDNQLKKLDKLLADTSQKD